MENQQQSTAEPTPEQPKKRGGKRPGAGRPFGSLKEENRMRLQLKNRWLQRTNKIADQIFDAHQDLALGHYTEIMTEDGKVRVYKKSPNPASLEWIMEHIWGRAPQKLTLDGEVAASSALSIETQAAITRAINYALPEAERKIINARKEPPRPADHVRSDVPENPSGK